MSVEQLKRDLYLCELECSNLRNDKHDLLGALYAAEQALEQLVEQIESFGDTGRAHIALKEIRSIREANRNRRP